MLGPSRAALVAAMAMCGLFASRARQTALAATGHRRFALVVGNNSGGDDTRPLLYATQDARRIHSLLTGAGGVHPDDAILLLDGTSDEFWRALGAVEAKVAHAGQAGERTALVVYYSGHAKDGVLRLGRTHVPMADVKAHLTAAPADVRIGIFDSCRSGVVTRTKGARRAPAFEVEANSGAETRGVVILTSSGFDEDSQEADSIGGSYFSHHLVSGLRGDADRSGDKRVTLSEAYAYAYAHTVADTADSAAGAQHPTFSYDLKGNGDLVLTDMGSWREGLVVPAAAPAGTYFVVDKDVIVAEIVKTTNVERQIAVGPGRYMIKRRLADRLRIGEVRISSGQLLSLDETTLHDAPFSDDPVKGISREPTSRFSLGVAGSLQAFFDAPTRDGLFPPAGLVGAELLVRDFFRRNWVWGADLAFGGTRGTLLRPTITLPFRFSEVALGSSLFAEWPSASGRVVPFFGARVAFMFMSRTFEGSAIPAQTFSTFSPGLLGGGRYRFSDGVSAVARARVHYLLYNIDENRSLGYWELALAMAYEF